MMEQRDPRSPDNASGPLSFLRMEKFLLGEASPRERAVLEQELSADPKRAVYFRKMRETRNPMNWSRLSARLHIDPATIAAGERRDVGSEAERNESKERRERMDRKLQNVHARGSFPETAAAWLNSILPFPSRSAMAWSVAIAVVLVVLPVSWMATHRESALRFKGSAIPEISLEIGGSRIAPGQTRHVTTGEILTFAYRSGKPLYAQIWYSEDNGSPVHFEGKDETSLFWTPASAWQTAPQRIRLEGDWRTQRILILASPKPVSGEDARRILTGNAKPGKGESILTFDLVQP
ncbi:MAG: hypothetical protein ABIW76_12315 [Fibrobacteria bacterium]